MKNSTKEILEELLRKYPALKTMEESLFDAVQSLIDAFAQGKKLLVCGNGGSAADALHIVGELMKDFVLNRPLHEADRQAIMESSEHSAYILENLQTSLPAIALVGSVAVESAYANDRAPDLAFAQQVYGYANEGDVFLGISTSGNSKNVIYAAEVANAKGLTTIGLTGASGGALKDKCKILLNAPETQTYQVQELHLPIYHAICLAVENEFFGE